MNYENGFALSVSLPTNSHHKFHSCQFLPIRQHQYSHNGVK